MGDCLLFPLPFLVYFRFIWIVRKALECHSTGISSVIYFIYGRKSQARKRGNSPALLLVP